MKIWIAWIAVMLSVPTWSQSPVEWFELGTAAYANQSYDSARVAFENVLEEGPQFEAFFNLGNTYYKLDDAPRAILNYRRAKRLKPFDEDLAVNLQLAESRIQDSIEPLDKAGVGTLVQGLQSPNATTTYTILSLLFACLVALFLWVRFTRPQRKRGATGLAILAGLFLVGTLALGSWAQRAQSGSPEAVLMAPKVDVFTAPDGANIAFVLHAGTVVKILETGDGWLKVEIANGEIGWMTDQGYERI